MSDRVTQSRWYRVLGRELHTRVSILPAPPERVPVVLVHGLVVSSRYMVPTLRRLGPHFPVYAPDLPGHGRSERPPRPLDIRGQADALEAFLDVALLDRVILVGNSAGCQVVAELGARSPERVERAVLLGPTVDPRANSALRQSWRWLRNGPHEPLSMALILLRDYTDFGWRRVPAAMRGILVHHIEERLPQLRCPTLVVRGGKDPIVPQRWAERACELLPQGRLAVIPGAPHTVNYSAAEASCRAMLSFLVG